MCFFFFSSRRRHTRLTCDWSSDVCSSDLPRPPLGSLLLPVPRRRRGHEPVEERRGRRGRSEERRVGKECSSRWPPYHSKIKASIIDVAGGLSAGRRGSLFPDMAGI